MCVRMGSKPLQSEPESQGSIKSFSISIREMTKAPIDAGLVECKQSSLDGAGKQEPGGFPISRANSPGCR